MSPFANVNLLTCPLCHSHLQSCGECDATVACSNLECAGSEVVDYEQCHEHERMTCYECLHSKELDGLDPNSGFVRCPLCNSWCCSGDVTWCPGRIIHPAPDKEPAELHPTRDLDSRPVVRSHLPTPGPCRFCIGSRHVAAWKACSGGRSNLSDCPSNSHFSEDDLNYAYCPECVTELEGRRCACGAVWLCDACSVADIDFPSSPKLISCPRCGAAYCRRSDGCRYCHFCQICLKTDICFGCQAREKGSDGGGGDTPGECSQPINALERCVNCRWDICKECCSTAKLGVTQCSGCHRWMCSDCSKASGRRKRCYLCRISLEGFEL